MNDLLNLLQHEDEAEAPAATDLDEGLQPA